MNYDEAFEELITHEGGFTRNPADRGNWTGGRIGKGKLKGTKYGISAMAFPYLDIENLTLEDAKRIYKNKYWNEVHCDELPKYIRFDMFDLAVNSGVRTAIKLLQRSVNEKVDGWYGPKTRAGVKATEPLLLLSRLNGYRLLMISKLQSFQNFGRGWTIRVGKNLIRY